MAMHFKCVVLLLFMCMGMFAVVFNASRTCMGSQQRILRNGYKIYTVKNDWTVVMSTAPRYVLWSTGTKARPWNFPIFCAVKETWSVLLRCHVNGKLQLTIFSERVLTNNRDSGTKHRNANARQGNAAKRKVTFSNEHWNLYTSVWKGLYAHTNAANFPIFFFFKQMKDHRTRIKKTLILLLIFTVSGSKRERMRVTVRSCHCGLRHIAQWRFQHYSSERHRPQVGWEFKSLFSRCAIVTQRRWTCTGFQKTSCERC